MPAITQDEWYDELNQIGQLRAALEAIIKEGTTEIDGQVYVPSGYGEVVRIAREALKQPNGQAQAGAEAERRSDSPGA